MNKRELRAANREQIRSLASDQTKVKEKKS